jgi:hypothetical protein
MKLRGIFRISCNFFLFRFIHFDQLYTSVTCQNLMDLAVAADYFGVATLKSHCDALVCEQISVVDIWTVLNKVIDAKKLDLFAESCKKVGYPVLTLNY